MALLNFSTTIAVAKTLSEIQQILASHGARSILVEYDDNRQPASLAFVIPTRFGTCSFRLPANIAGIAKTLEQHYNAGKVARRYATAEQAARVGWRILRDWIQAQVAIIEAGMAQLDQVMLPYLIGESGATLYEEFNEKQMLLLPGKVEEQ